MSFFGTGHSDCEVETGKEGKLQVDRRLRIFPEDGQEARDGLGCCAPVMTMIEPRGWANEAAE